MVTLLLQNILVKVVYRDTNNGGFSLGKKRMQHRGQSAVCVPTNSLANVKVEQN